MNAQPGVVAHGKRRRAMAVLVTLTATATTIAIALELGRRAGELKAEMLAQETRAARDHLVLAAASSPEQFVVLIATPDPWGNAYLHRPSRGEFRSLLLICKGPDGSADTDDDILTHRFLAHQFLAMDGQ